ncbi:hypothetical protein HDU98_005768 [Podochytrium sp. JEL0797]|nr:hypothetical protein HDU98_005768 [Podochytrium sp. JEL0797]
MISHLPATTNDSPRRPSTSGTTSTPAKRISGLSSQRPPAVKPHGLKSAFKGIFKPPASSASSKKQPDVKIVSYSAHKKAVVVEPVEKEKEEVWMQVGDAPPRGDSLPPSVNVASALSEAYKDKLSKKYTYSSVFTKHESLGRPYTEPDLDSFSYSEPSHHLPSIFTTLDRDDMEPTDLLDDGEYVLSGTEYIDRFDAAHGPDSADTESLHTIHNIRMLPPQDPPPANPRPAPFSPITDTRRKSTGHIALLETYADIMGEISDLVPPHEMELSPPPAARNRRSSMANLEALLENMDLSYLPEEEHVLRSVPSSYSILKAYEDSEGRDGEEEEEGRELDGEVVIEEYFVEHWVPSRMSAASSEGAESPAVTPRLETVDEVVDDVPVSADGNNDAETSPTLVSSFEVPVAAEIDISSRRSSADDSDTGLSDASEHLIVSKVTRVVTLSRNKDVTKVQVRVEPLGKVAATPGKMVRRASQVNLRQMVVEEDEGKGKGGLVVVAAGKKGEKRKSGLSQFLNFLASH